MTARPPESVVNGSKASPQDLPGVDYLLRLPAAQELVALHGQAFVTAEVRGLLEGLRRVAIAGALDTHALRDEALALRLHQRVDAALAPRLRRVFNLSGTVIHTNLGRALLADHALQHLLRTMAGPNNLEFDLQTGARGDRDSVVEGLLCKLTGAEAATVVNNNAAAVLLTIAALARGREVLVSRGELVEIGGAFRMPDVMTSAGATLVEVGTTNRTHAADYERAIGERTALLMKVHTSNYAIQGFTSSVDERDLAPIARKHGVMLATDLGSGSLVDLSKYGLPREPMPQDKLADGCDVVTFSGDKLLGGPQAGLIVGTRLAVDRIRKFPMKRALRVSKLPLAALEATLQLYLTPEKLPLQLPTLRLLTRSEVDIQALAHRLLPAMADAVGPRYQGEVVPMRSQIGSGSLPIDRLPSAGLSLTPVQAKGAGRALDALACALRELPVPVIGRIANDALLLDLRCLEDEGAFVSQLPALRAALA